MAITAANGIETATAQSATQTGVSIDNTAYRRTQGFDLAYFQAQLQGQGQKLEDQLRAVQANENLSDTERMFEMQMLMNTWSTITNLRTNMMKSISDTLKTVVRNVA
ncbi:MULTISPECIES: EscF/YscF/HrpA family type III secretion system needle major subunit [Aquibium]|uniref:EscF/YscF/HrpA family type III secretion system needle major subunit n=1 Tax=Aquibium TaxID=2911176 RepID=UPI00165D0610|nr:MULTISPECIES: EscF/YscF/HrpA family type III secretion system needle major subunit [Aquibium]MDN2581422.1 EscF/YscF/HrpA family type III secretion system needle major subunit [Aquibium sp. ELW1220]